MIDLTNNTISSARDGLKSGDFTAVELVNEHLRKMEKLSFLNAFITETPDIALRRAEESDARRASGNALGSMDGIPIAVKDLFCTKGTTYNSGIAYSR